MQAGPCRLHPHLLASSYETRCAGKTELLCRHAIGEKLLQTPDMRLSDAAVVSSL